jgi:hypothetical protein
VLRDPSLASRFFSPVRPYCGVICDRHRVGSLQTSVQHPHPQKAPCLGPLLPLFPFLPFTRALLVRRGQSSASSLSSLRPCRRPPPPTAPSSSSPSAAVSRSLQTMLAGRQCDDDLVTAPRVCSLAFC